MVTLMREEKVNVVKNLKLHDNDNGSSEVQIALLTDRIQSILGHLKTHKKDVHARHGLIILVGRRKSLLKYLKGKDEAKYFSVCKELGLRA